MVQLFYLVSLSDMLMFTVIDFTGCKWLVPFAADR